MRLTFDAGVHARHEARPFPGAGGDAGLLRLVTAGAEPLTIVEYTSEDHEWVPLHLHPWDEFVYVLEGEMEFVAGDATGGGGPGTIQALPRGVAHTARVPLGLARYLMITVGAPSAEFLTEIGQVYAEGPTLDRLVDIAGRHGVRLAGSAD